MIILTAGEVTIHCLVLGQMMTNCYIIAYAGPVSSARPGEAAPAAEPPCWVVDPGLSPEPLLQYLRAKGLTPRRILLTHCHGDHIAGVGAVKRAWPGAVLTVPSREVGLLCDPVRNLSLPFGFRISAPEPDEVVPPGQELSMGDVVWLALDTCGHTPGGLSYYCAAAGVVLVGDALFADSIGRTDIPGASEAKLLRNIRKSLLTLPDETRVLPGHGPQTTIGQERRCNPFLR